METDILHITPEEQSRSSLRLRADRVRGKKCRTMICVLENPKNPSNIGAVIRNVDMLGVGKLYIIGPRPTAHAFKKISSSAMGSEKWVYVHYFDSARECLEYLSRKKVPSVVTSSYFLGRKNIELTHGDYTRYRYLAVWFGNESLGVSQEAINASEACINIEMAGIGDSLNLSVSTGIVLHYITAQRREWKRNKTRPKRKS
jgi:tRNA (guanosine-2'-O-)-methyltransferase